MVVSNFLSRPLTKQFLAFALIGLTSTVLNYLVFFILLIFIRVQYIYSAAFGFISGVFFSFIFNKKYAFNSSEKFSTSLISYALIYSISLAVNLIILKILVENFKLNPVVSNALLIPPIVLINFFGSKIIAFKNDQW